MANISGYVHANRKKEIKLQGKTATSNGLVTPDEGYDGLASVDVNISGSGGTGEKAYLFKESVITEIKQITQTEIEEFKQFAAYDNDVYIFDFKAEQSYAGVVEIYYGADETFHFLITGLSLGQVTVVDLTIDDIIERGFLGNTKISKQIIFDKRAVDWLTKVFIGAEYEEVIISNVPYKPEKSVVIGFDNLSDESGDLRWTDSIQDFENYTTETNGNYVSVKSPLDDVFPYNMIHEVTDNNNNVFISFPKCYIRWKRTETGELDGIQISSSIPADDSEGWFIPDCFLDPRDETNSTYLDETWIGKYEGWRDGEGRFCSLSGKTPTVNVTITEVQTACRKWSFDYDYYHGYQMYNFSQMTLYNFLCMLYYKVSNIQKIYSGRTSQSSAASTGSCDGVTGLNGWNTNTTCVKMLGVENPYGNIYKFVGGIYFNSGTIYADRNPVMKGTFNTSDKETLDFTQPTSSAYIKYLKAGNTPETQSYVYASATGGSGTTYVGDYCYYGSGNVVLFCGGDWSIGAAAGLWCLHGYYGASYSNSVIGGRLSRTPLD